MTQRALEQLLGGEVDTVAFVRDYVELRIDSSIVRALTNPTGMIDGTAWAFGDAGAADVMLRYIGRHVVDVEIVEGEHIVLLLEDGATFVIPLREVDRVGPEAAHLVPASPDGLPNTEAMTIW